MGTPHLSSAHSADVRLARFHSTPSTTLSRSRANSTEKSAKEPKQPKLLIHVAHHNLPNQPHHTSSRIVCRDASTREVLAATEWSRHPQPVYDTPIELWDDASGKGAVVMLNLAVEAAPPDSDPADATLREIASATIASDELRRCGHGMPREGAALGLPLIAAGGERLDGALLHCHIHAGYGRRPATLPDRGSWKIESAAHASPAPGELLVHVRATNCTDEALLLHEFRLAALPPCWERLRTPSVPAATVPSAGVAHAAFRLRAATSGSAANDDNDGCARDDCTVSLAFAPASAEDAAFARVEQQCFVHLPALGLWLASLEVRPLSPLPWDPRVGQRVDLPFELSRRDDASGLARGDTDDTNVEVELVAGDAWAPIGLVRQRGRLPPRAPLLVTFSVLASRQGCVELPSVRVWRVSDPLDVVLAAPSDSWSRVISVGS